MVRARTDKQPIPQESAKAALGDAYALHTIILSDQHFSNEIRGVDEEDMDWTMPIMDVVSVVVLKLDEESEGILLNIKPHVPPVGRSGGIDTFAQLYLLSR